MSRIWKAALRLALDMAQAVAFLPLYTKVVVALVLAGWVVLVADWDEFFPPSANPVSVSTRETAPAEPAKPETVAAVQKEEERLPMSGPSTDMTGRFTIADPRVGPDGSIADGENGAPFFLSELKSFSAKDVCTRADGERWACGLHAYATLRNSIVHKTLECRNAGSREEPQISCQMGTMNIALILIKDGLVELKDGATDQDLLAAQEKARAARAGIWNR